MFQHQLFFTNDQLLPLAYYPKVVANHPPLSFYMTTSLNLHALFFFFKDFYDGMEEMRESYGDNVAFLYISDDMKWGRKNLKDKENDLYFVGMGNTNGE